MRTSPWSNPCLTALRAATPWAILAALSAPALWAETVPLNNFSVPPGATVTITVDVDVKDPLAICAAAVANQGSFSGANLSPAVLTDDPDVAGAANPTLTAIDVVDLAVLKTDSAATEVPGTPVTYTITVSNAGPSPAVGATVSDTFPAILSGVTWTCVGSGGATCSAAGSGNLSDLVNVPVGGAATYTVNATISAAASGTLVNTATVTKAANQIECNLANNSSTDTDTLTPQVDLAITKTDGLTTINAGSTTSYTITVTNSGPSDAIGATVADTFPAALLTPSWTCVASALSSCTAGPTSGNINDVVTVRSGGTLTYTVNATVSGAFSGTLSNTATVAAPGGTTDTNAGNNSATDNTTVNAVADVAITKDDGVTTAVPGQSVVYTLVASNAGPSAAPAALVTDTFPAACASVSWTCVGAGGGSCPANGSGNLNATVNLPMGGTATFSVTCNIASSATGSLANTATIGAGAGVTDPNAANNTASDTDTLTPQANLAISKSNGVSSVDAGASTTYTITASNAGPSDAPGATVADTFPAILTGVTWTCAGAGGGTCPANGSGNLAAVVSLPAGGSVTFSATGTVSAAATGTLVNTATVTEPGGVTETAPGNNTSTDTDTITISTDLSITKTDGVATEVPGTGVVYTIVVGNAGPSNALGATVADTFPATLTGVTWTCVGAGGGTCTAAGSGNLNTTVDLPVGGTATFSVSATIDAAATGTLVNTATVTVAGGTTDPNAGNNTATDTDTLTPQVDLAITKTDGLTTANAGAATSYTIVVTNSGPSDAVSATVADSFPAALLSPTWTCVASPLSSCAAAGSGNLNDSVTVRSGGTLTYTVNATISGTFSGILSNTATVTAPGGTTDTNGANNSATDTTDVLPVADLSITKTDSVTTAVPGLTVSYTIIAANAGPATATGASVTDTFPAACASVSWTCVGAGGGTCTAGPVAGNIADSANLPAGATATYTAVCTLANNASGSLVNTVTIGGGGVTDNVPANNSATDTDTILALDFGDAPDGSLAAPSGYPTLLVDNGARHGVTTLKMGTNLDSEADGQPTVNADGDDTNPALGPDDEDGVTLPAFLVACESTTVTVNASGVAKLDAWVDFNANGSFADPGEKVFNNQALVAGANVLPLTVPCDLTPATKSFARFRLSTVGGLAATGVAADGEVEDYTVAQRGVDFGDAPDPTFPTLFASNGARHVVNGASPGPFLGALRDTEANGQPNVGATGDDLAGTDDEDGVLFTTPLIPGQSASVTVTATAIGNLRAWVDWDGDGSWATVGDELVFSPGATLAAGANVLTFTVPATANSSLTTYARFRFASTAVAGFSGLENDGEVEDHQVQTAAVADVSISKTDGTTTEIPGTSVTYTIVVANAGPDAVPSATVTDTFPAVITGVTWTCVGAGGGTCPANGAGNLNQAVNLPNGGSVTFTVTGTIAPDATGTLANTATVATGSVFDPNAGNNTATDTDTLTPQADLSVTKTDGVASEIPGTPASYTIVVANAGPSTATAASVADTFPASLTACSWTSVAAGGATGNDAGPIAGNIADGGITLPPAASVTYTVTCNIDPAARGTLANTATVASPVTDPNAGNNTATDTDTLTPQIDLVVVKTESADPVTAGSGANNLTHTVTVTNNGPSTATSVTLSDVITVPAGTTIVSVVASQGTFTTPNWALGTLAPAGTATLTVTYTVGASTATGTDTVCDTATVTGAAETLIATGNDTDTECTSVQRRVDIVVAKTESIDPVIAGSGTGNLTYVVTVTNNGPSDASGITLSEVLTLPAGVTQVSATPSQGTFAAPTWTVGNLASGASATLTVVLTASAAAVPGTDVICDTASLTAVNETQVATGNESDTECTSIVTSADLAITKIDDADPPPAGADLTYTISVTNNGPSNATGVVVTDPLPGAVTYVSDTCGASNVPPWTWNIGTLNNGASVTCDIVVSINPTPPGSISNTATVTATTNDAVGSNNSDTETTTLDAVPPQVANLTTLADTADGELTECETVFDRKVNAIVLTFNEAMAETGAGSASDPANYRLIQPGANQAFNSTGCTVAGDDVAVPLSSASYDSGSLTATVVAATALGDSPYRFVACDTLTDAASNPLDGDANGSPGPALVRGFRVDPLNLFANGHFDCDLSGWMVTAATAGEIVHGTADVDGAPISGSARVTNLAPGTDTTFTLDQCVPVVGGINASLGSRARLTAGPTVSINLVRQCEFFSGVCTGALGTVSNVVALLDTAGTWLPQLTIVPIPPGALTAKCRFRFETPTAATFTGELDRLIFRLDGAIFADGFENGTTSAWSSCAGCTP